MLGRLVLYKICTRRVILFRVLFAYAHNLFYFSKFFPQIPAFIPFKKSLFIFYSCSCCPTFFTQSCLDLPFWFRIITKKTHSIFTQREKLILCCTPIALKTVYQLEMMLPGSKFQYHLGFLDSISKFNVLLHKEHASCLFSFAFLLLLEKIFFSLFDVTNDLHKKPWISQSLAVLYL